MKKRKPLGKIKLENMARVAAFNKEKQTKNINYPYSDNIRCSHPKELIEQNKKEEIIIKINNNDNEEKNSPSVKENKIKNKKEDKEPENDLNKNDDNNNKNKPDIFENPKKEKDNNLNNIALIIITKQNSKLNNTTT